ncbi:MAG: OmpH family outer membrane protein [Pseudomonadota bacterium]
MTQKNIIITVIACIVCVGLLGFSLGVNRFLIPSANLKVAVVDGDRLKKEAKAFHTANDILVAEQSKAHAEILPIESALSKEQDEIKREAKTDPENAKKRRIAFEERVAEVDKKVQKKRDVIYKQFTYLTETIQEMVFAIINEIAREQNISLVLNKTVDEKLAVFFVEKRMDLTGEVIAELDKRLKNIKLPEITE